jgi:hypothetical protein
VEGHKRRASELCTELRFSSFFLLLLFGLGDVLMNCVTPVLHKWPLCIIFLIL